METSAIARADRRLFMGGILASGALALPGCASIEDYVVTKVVRSLMKKSAENAITNLMAPNGAWDQEIRTAGLAEGVGLRGKLLAAALTSEPVKAKAEEVFIHIAKDATDAAAPTIADTIRKIGIRKSIKIAKGGPEAATQFLREQIQSSIAESSVGRIVSGMDTERLQRLRTILQGVDQEELQTAGKQIAARIENVFWREMGKEEAKIRANPEATGDADLIKLLGKGE